MKKNMFKLSLVAAACMTAMTAAQAGKIVGTQQALPSPVVDAEAQGFGAWNLGNVNVKIVDVDTGEELAKAFTESDGSYSAMTYGDTFVSEVDDGAGNVMGNLYGKDWPVGEPSGVKAISVTDPAAVLSNSKPASCIMSTSYYKFSDNPNYSGSTPDDGWLDSDNPNPTLCDSPFQTHKRFKVSALPTTVDGAGNEGIDLVFNVEDEAGSRRYMVLQKLNNYTDSRLSGFKIEVGFGVGAGFTPGDAGGNLTLSIGTGEDVSTTPAGDIFDAEDLAPFSAGLFGPADPPKHPSDGFFSDQRAYFPVKLTNDYTIENSGPLTANYTDIFGDWMPSIYEPAGIFYDFDDNPLTDDRLVAFWGDDPATAEVDYQWLSGFADDFAPISADQLEAWAEDDSGLYSIGSIEDVLNLGLSYIVEIGDVTADVVGEKDFTENGTFTIRLTPIKSTTDESVPEYVNDDTQEAPADLTVYEKSSSSNGFSAYDNTSLLASVLAFLGLGALVARRKLSK
ncbi:choice-of-anchor F family protein [Thiomicrorhabdus chilensis]|uniref:choice-of-anchor F family protein n=1 Tax=Thiomicrorhabdus chilensis TaxID=63656 RepID=UPI00042001F5|nr:choice-of-anchor F family protein [Thiomicrorhabdus chilensis]